jgi:hypothetical protein
MWRCIAFVCAAFLILGWPVRASAGAGADELVETFVHLSTGQEDGTPGSPSVMRRWERPLSYASIGAPTEQHEKRVDDHFALLSALSRLPITKANPLAFNVDPTTDRSAFVPRTKDYLFSSNFIRNEIERLVYVTVGNKQKIAVYGADLIVIWLDKDSARVIPPAFSRFAPKAIGDLSQGRADCACLYLNNSKTHEIDLAVVFLRFDLDEWLAERCVQEELTQVMGLIDDVKGSSLTLFNDDYSDKRSSLTEFDKIFVRMLYDPRMRSGQTASEVRAVAKQIIPEYYENRR